MTIIRRAEAEIIRLLKNNAAVGLLGPRQVGKTTLARAIANTRASNYLDLESATDRARIAEPELYLARHTELVILDEVQKTPDLFMTLRGLIDEGRRAGAGNGRFLILGSASPELLKQSAESLAGRIAYIELTPLMPSEVSADSETRDRLWLRGGFPRSFLAGDDRISFEWRDDFLRTYLERDIPQLGPSVPAETLRRFWTMLAHNQGTPLNAARIAAGLGVSGQTVARYLDLMVDLLLVRRLAPWSANAGKRMVRSPKTYVRDSGLAHALLGIENGEQLLGHPVVGASWEGFVIESLIAAAPRNTEASFYRTATGDEIDLVLTLPRGRSVAFEVKRSLAPTLEKGFHAACEDVRPAQAFVVYPGTERFPLAGGIDAISINEATALLETE